jgi:hypothetical protein
MGEVVWFCFHNVLSLLGGDLVAGNHCLYLNKPLNLPDDVVVRQAAAGHHSHVAIGERSEPAAATISTSIHALAHCVGRSSQCWA